MKKIKKSQAGSNLGSIYTGNDYSKSPAVTAAKAKAAKNKAALDKNAKAVSENKKAAIKKLRNNEKFET
jgi:hypothetical protein